MAVIPPEVYQPPAPGSFPPLGALALHDTGGQFALCLPQPPPLRIHVCVCENSGGLARAGGSRTDTRVSSPSVRARTRSSALALNLFARTLNLFSGRLCAYVLAAASFFARTPD